MGCLKWKFETAYFCNSHPLVGGKAPLAAQGGVCKIRICPFRTKKRVYFAELIRAVNISAVWARVSFSIGDMLPPLAVRIPI